MEQIKLENDLTVFCVTASSFPEGILAAHQQLHNLAPLSAARTYFGISHPTEKGAIVYKAAASEIEKEELSRHGLERFTIPKGNYACITLKNFTEDPQGIQKAFDNLLHNEPVDPKGFCLEWCQDQDVRCMVRLRS